MFPFYISKLPPAYGTDCEINTLCRCASLSLIEFFFSFLCYIRQVNYVQFSHCYTQGHVTDKNGIHNLVPNLMTK